MRELCSGLSRAGVATAVATTLRGHNPSVDAKADSILENAGVKISYFPTVASKWLGERYAFSPVLGRFLNETVDRYDLVHIHALWQYPTFVASRACQRLKIPYLISPCGLLDEYSLRRSAVFKKIYGVLVERSALAKASCIHFTSDMEKQQAFLFWTNPPTAVIPRSIRLEDISGTSKGQFRASFPETGNRSILLFLGRLHPKKRLDIVVDAFTFLASRMDNIHLVIAGPDDGTAEEARHSLQKSGLLEKATFTGSLSGTAKWSAFQDADLFLLPSEDENFGMAALEAMAVGVPVLVSDKVGLASVVSERESGLVLQKDWRLWSNALEQLLGNTALRQKMGERGRRLVSDQFTTERVATAMKNLYSQVLTGLLPAGN